jgi:hypothetical protein
MRRRLPAIGLALLLAGLLFLIASGAFEEAVIVPLLFLWWVARVLYMSLPQALVWGAFVAIAAVLVAKSLSWRAAPLPIIEPQAGSRGRVADWSRWLRESGRDDHARWRLAQRLSQLAVETLALREQCPPEEVGRRLEDGSLDLPPELRAYLRAGLALYAPRPRSTRRFGQPVQNPAQAEPLTTDPQLLIDFLEDTVQRTIGAA